MSRYISMLYKQDDGYFNHIEGLRAIAGIWVALLHVAFFVSLSMGDDQFRDFSHNTFFKMGLGSSVSLDTFFLITGFVVGFSLLKYYKKTGQANLYNFLVRRCARVYPMYLVILVLGIILGFRNPHMLWSNLLQINNQMPLKKQYLVWTWSLAVDFQFYITFALVVWLLSKNFITTRICLWLGVGFFLLPIVITPLIIHTHHLGHYTLESFMINTNIHPRTYDQLFDKTYVRCGPIFYGMMVAYIFVYRKEQLDTFFASLKTWHINMISFFMLFLMVFSVTNDPIWTVHYSSRTWQTHPFWAMIGERHLFTIGLSLLLLLANQSRGFIVQGLRWFLSHIIWRPIGQLTFTTYLIHPPILLFGGALYAIMHPYCTPEEYLRNGLICIAISYLCAIPFYLYVEQPAMRKIKDIMLSKQKGDGSQHSPSPEKAAVA